MKYPIGDDLIRHVNVVIHSRVAVRVPFQSGSVAVRMSLCVVQCGEDQQCKSALNDILMKCIFIKWY